MSDHSKISPLHLHRAAVVYIRQSSAAQVEHNRESTARQYALADRAVALGWRRDQVSVIDQDLGLSGASAVQRSGFAQLTAEVALGHVGLVLGLEVSRLARNNADWYRLLDLCGMTDTLIGDADGLYHPGLFEVPSIPMLPWSPPSARYSNVLPNWGQREGYGSGFTRRD